jgi:RimJ/RimL family protein N-acetyltransferase
LEAEIIEFETGVLMATSLPGIDSYPKTILLRDRTDVIVRPLAQADKIALLNFFEGIPEEERFYLKENVASPAVIQSWTSDVDFRRVIPIVAVQGDQIVADATLHRSRAQARQHVGEIRVVVAPAYREIGLGGRLIRELLDIAAGLGLNKAMFELVADHEGPAIAAAASAGFREVAVLKDHVRDIWGNYHDLVLMELSLKERRMWWF